MKILAISGSLRKESYNKKALGIAKSIAKNLGAREIEEADLKQLNLPVFDEDIEKQGYPPQVTKLIEMVKVSDILLIATPEYNHSIPGGLKNAIDWISRDDFALEGKIAAIFGVSPGIFGTIRAQEHLRQILASLNVFVLPQPRIFIAKGHEAFDENGNFKNPKDFEKLKNLIEKILEFAKNRG